MDRETEVLGAFLAVIEVDRDLTITGWHGRAQQIFGTASDAAIGRGLAELLPIEGGVEGWRATLAVESEGPRTWAIAGPDRSLVLEAWTQVRRDAAGAAVGYVLHGHDVTSRAAAERQAALESAMLAAIKDHLEVVVWAIDREANFIYQEGKGVYTAGMQPGQLVGMNVAQVYPSLSERELIARALVGEPSHGPATPVHDRYWDTWFIPVPDNPSDAAVVGISLDVTEVKRRELELRERIELIERQQETIRALSTPIIEVWEGVLTMPIVGLVDSMRAADVMNNLLQAVTETRARYAILDLTGVDVVDTGTASHLIEMIHAIGMLGAKGILTGIRPAIAQTIVALDVDLSRVAVFAKLRDALMYCLRAGAGRRA